MKIVRLLLERAIDLTISANLLGLAARYGTFETFKSIWTRGLEPGVSLTLLQAAAENERQLTTLKFLLDKVEDRHMSEEITNAIIDREKGAIEMLELCIDRKLSLNITHNVLLKAAENTSTSESLMKFLLNHAIDIAITDEIFQSAAAAGQHQLLRILSHHCGIDKVVPKWIDIAKLHDAAAQSVWYFEYEFFGYNEDSSNIIPSEPDADISLVRDLLSQDIPFDLPDGKGSTPVALAAEAGNEVIVKLLLDAGADPDSRDQAGRSPLFNAASRGHYEIVMALLEKGVERDVVHIDGKGIAEMAKEGAHMRVFRLLERYNKEGR